MDLNDLGLELLMNKKKISSDAVSVLSGSSDGGGGGSMPQGRPTFTPNNNGEAMSVRSLSVSESPSGSGADEDDYDEYEEDPYEAPKVEQVNVGYDFKRPRPRTPQSASESGEYSEEQSVTEYPRRMSNEEILQAKQELLYQFDRLEKKGMRLPRKFTMQSSLDDMKAEFARLKRDREIDNSVKFQRKVMMAVVSGVELLNNKFDPFNIQLNGWSDSIHDNIDEYDDVFEELHDKYSGKAKIAPELKLLMMLGGSAFMFHMTNSMFKQFPGAEQVFKENPDLRRQFAAATANTMSKQNEGNGLFGGLSNMFSGLFGGGGGAPQNAPGSFNPPPPPTASPPRPAGPRPQMKGPSNMDQILRELEIPPLNNDRIEMMSTVTDSELGDDASLNGLLMNKKRGKRAVKSGLTLDI
jgi:hypothetical protein